MLPDDIFRDRLEQTLVEIEIIVSKLRGCAAVDVAASPHYWQTIVLPFFELACPFELMIKSNQTFSLKLANEVFEDRPIKNFELFPHLVRAINEGSVEKISKFDAMTDSLVAIEMHVALGPGWDWRGERRLTSVTPSEEWRTHRYLAYRR